MQSLPWEGTLQLYRLIDILIWPPLSLLRLPGSDGRDGFLHQQIRWLCSSTAQQLPVDGNDFLPPPIQAFFIWRKKQNNFFEKVYVLAVWVLENEKWSTQCLRWAFKKYQNRITTLNQLSATPFYFIVTACNLWKSNLTFSLVIKHVFLSTMIQKCTKYLVRACKINCDNSWAPLGN